VSWSSRFWCFGNFKDLKEGIRKQRRKNTEGEQEAILKRRQEKHEEMREAIERNKEQSRLKGNCELSPRLGDI